MFLKSYFNIVISRFSFSSILNDYCAIKVYLVTCITLFDEQTLHGNKGGLRNFGGRKVWIFSSSVVYMYNLATRGKKVVSLLDFLQKISKMLKFQQRATPEDLKIAASIERKRQLEEARKLRIFNPRIRKIGVRVTQIPSLIRLRDCLLNFCISYFFSFKFLIFIIILFTKI